MPVGPRENWLRGQDLNLRPSGYEATDEGLQAGSKRANPSESLDSLSGPRGRQVQAESNQHKNFGQPVVSDMAVMPRPEEDDEPRLTPAQAATRFQVPEYLLRKACSEGRLERLRVVNTLWLSPGAVAVVARALATQKPREALPC